MRTQEIPETAWLEFGDGFSRRHAGWPATIELIDPEAGPQRIATELPLHGISFDTAGTRPSSVAVSVGGDPGSNISHTVELPLHIRLAEDDSGAGGTLQIEPARGPQTLVHFRQPS